MALIKRTQTPPFRKKVKHYKPYLRIDFDYRCAYCKNREPVEGGHENFEIDHYKPLCKFPHLKFDYQNLFYCCQECNGHKGGFYPNIFEYLKRKYILNPCKHDFCIHYDVTRPVWKGKTSTAIWNIEILRLNSKRRVKFREEEEEVIDVIDDLTSKKAELQDLLSTPNLSNTQKEKIKDDLNKTKKTISILTRKTFQSID